MSKRMKKEIRSCGLFAHKQEEIEAALKANGLAIEWSLPISEFHVPSVEV